MARLLVLWQITSKPTRDRLAIPLLGSDFAEGGLGGESFGTHRKVVTAMLDHYWKGSRT